MTDGKACRKCGEWRPLAEYYVKRDNRDGLDHKCKPCVRQATRAYVQANPEKVAARTRVYRERNADRLREQGRRYREENRDALRAAKRQRYWSDPDYRRRQRALVAAWLAAHPEYMAQHYRAKRAKRLSVISEPFDPADVWSGECGICREVLDASIQYPDPLSKSLDHIVPLARGGTHTLANVQWAHLACNVRKGASVSSVGDFLLQGGGSDGAASVGDGVEGAAE